MFLGRGVCGDHLGVAGRCFPASNKIYHGDLIGASKGSSIVKRVVYVVKWDQRWRREIRAEH